MDIQGIGRGGSRSWIIPLCVFSDASKASQLHQDAVAAVREGAEISLDWSETRHLHASALQILLALRADLAAHGRTWKVQGAEKAPKECQWVCRLLEAA
jgi:MFS superfamily sulfate permease-like transporter